jgi:ATP adenylyltransferase
MDYIEKCDEEGCFLCDVLAGKEDRESLVLYRGEESFVIVNKYPYNSGHLMVVCNSHTPNILELSSSCRDEMMSLCAKSMDILKEQIDAQGFNCGMNFGRIAGAGVEDHFHLHVVPRWAGDTNFFPVLADTKSMPEYLEKTYDRLAEAFKRL